MLKQNFINAKPEIRNPKQIRMTEIPNSKHFEDLIDVAYVSGMFCFRIPSFGIRNSEAFDI